MFTPRRGPVVVSVNLKEEKKPRQWLDVVAIFLSILGLCFTLYVFYFSELRVADDLTATIIGLNPDRETNGFYTVEMGLMLRNEGNRQVVVPRIRLGLSETSVFDLTVWHPWAQSSPLVIAAKQTAYETVVFGSGYKHFQMIESRKPDMPKGNTLVVNVPFNAQLGGGGEPVIYGKLTIDAMDSHGNMHEHVLKTGTLQRGPGLRVDPAFSLPLSFRLLPSKEPAPRMYGNDPVGQFISAEWQPKVGTNTWGFEYSGPLGVRLPGVYTNAESGGWLEQPPRGVFGFGFAGSALVGGTGVMQEVQSSQLLGNLDRGEVERLISKDGLHVASIIAIRTNKHWLVALDGKDGPEFDGIGADSFLFSTNGEHFAYVAQNGDKRCVVLDQRVGPKFDGIGMNTLLFSTNSEHLAYVAINAGKEFAVLDEKAGPEFDGIIPGSLGFTFDGKSLTYAGMKDGKRHLVIDGVTVGILEIHDDGTVEIKTVPNKLGEFRFLTGQ